MSNENDTADKSRGTTRRRFLGAAAVASTLPALSGRVTGDTEQSTTTSESTADAGFSAAVELPENFTDTADYELAVSNFEDEHVDVELVVDLEIGRVYLGFTQREAEAFAQELTAAARRGANGAGE